MSAKTTIEIPARVAFVNIKDGSVFFDCSPAEGRLASKFITKIRKDKNFDVFYKARRELIQMQREAAFDSRKKWRLAPESSSPWGGDNALTINGLNQMFTVVEAKDYVPTVMIVNARNFADIRNWGKSVYEEYTSEEIANTGAYGRIWTAEILVSRRVKFGKIILVSYYKSVEGQKIPLEKCEVFKFIAHQTS